MAISITWPTGVIFVPKADMTLVQSTPSEIRELNVNTFRLTLKDLEDDAEGQVWPTTHNHFTTVTVGGVTLARVVELINGYTVTFEDGQYAVNLTGANSNIADKTNVNQVSVRSSNSAGLIDLNTVSEGVFATQKLVEGLRQTHTGYGNIYYWDPINGNDANDGKRPLTATLTFARVHSLVTSGNHDIIIALPGTTTETIQITKSWVFLRGPGFNFKFQPTTVPASKAVVEINADGVELSGFEIDLINCSDPNSIGVKKTGKYFLLEDMFIENAKKQGLLSINGHDEAINNCSIAYNGTDGIEITNAGVGSRAEHITIRNCHIDSNLGSGINLTGTAVHEVIIRDNTLLHGSSEYGLKVGTGAEETHIFPDVLFRDNVLGEISDSGTKTLDDRFILWDAQIAGHLGVGTTGKALSDAGSAGNPWGSPITGNTNAGTFGELVGKKLLTVGKFLGLK